MTGSIQGKNGKWYMVISYKDMQNNWKTKWKSTGLSVRGNKKLAEQMLKEELNTLTKNSIEISEIKLADYFQKWTDEQKFMVEPNTYRSYKGNMENHIIPYFRMLGLKLTELKTYHLEEYYRCKQKTTSNTRRKQKTV